ncbi:MFS transporter [soil metagenome]
MISTAFVRTPTTWLAYLLTGYFLYLQSALGPLMPFLRAELGMSYTTASLHFSAFALGVMPAGLLGDRLSGTFGRRRMIWGGGSVIAAGAVLLMIGVHPAVTLVGTLMMGMFGGLLLMNLQATLSDAHGEKRSVAISESNVVASLCAVVAPLTIGAFERAGILGWRGAVLAAVAALAIVFWRFRRAPIPNAQPTDPDDKVVSSSPLPPLFWGYGTVLFLATAVEWSMAFWGAAFLQDEVGFRKADAATLMGAFFVAMLLGRAAGSRLARRISAAKILFSAQLVAIAGFAFFWFVPLTASGTWGAASSVAGLFVTGLGVANLYPFALSAATGIVPEQADRAVARIALLGSSAILLAPFVLGSAADVIGIGKAYGVVAVILLAAVATTGAVNHRAAVSGRLPS